MSHIPYRTGLTVIFSSLKAICRIGAKYRSLWITFMTSEQIAKFDALMELCEEIIVIIEQLRST